jgi:hypothetical protein
VASRPSSTVPPRLLISTSQALPFLFSVSLACLLLINKDEGKDMDKEEKEDCESGNVSRDEHASAVIPHHRPATKWTAKTIGNVRMRQR